MSVRLVHSVALMVVFLLKAMNGSDYTPAAAHSGSFSDVAGPAHDALKITDLRCSTDIRTQHMIGAAENSSIPRSLPVLFETVVGEEVANGGADACKGDPSMLEVLPVDLSLPA